MGKGYWWQYFNQLILNNYCQLALFNLHVFLLIFTVNLDIVVVHTTSISYNLKQQTHVSNQISDSYGFDTDFG